MTFHLFGQETKEVGLDIVFHLDTCAGVRISFLVGAVIPWTVPAFYVRPEDLLAMSVDLCKHCQR